MNVKYTSKYNWKVWDIMKKQYKPIQAEKTPLRVAAYLRVSTEEQAISGLGIEAQLAKAEAMCTIKNWPLPCCIYIDDGVSGTIPIAEREQGKLLLADIASGKLDALIIASLDRLARKAIFILNFVDETKDAIQLVSCKESLDTSTAAGRFVLAMFAALAEMERDTISERTTSAFDAKGKRDGIKSGLPPFGYQHEYSTKRGLTITIDEAKAVVVRRIFELRTTGLPLRAIASQIESEYSLHMSYKNVGNILNREEVYRGSLMGESDNHWPVILV